MYNYRLKIKEMLAHPSQLMVKKPFTRGCEDNDSLSSDFYGSVAIGEVVNVVAPRFKRKTITVEQYARELDPNCHDVLFDENIPSLCVKVNKDDYREVKYKKMSLPIQRIIKNKQTMHLAAKHLQFTLLDREPSQVEQENYIMFKQGWDMKNMEGLKYKMVDTQKSFGDAGWLFYFNNDKELKSKIISYMDGYVICSHNDIYGERIMECLYYIDNEVEHLDCYDKKYITRFIRSVEYSNDNLNSNDYDGWTLFNSEKHGFNEIPLITKRGMVAWDNVQPIIEAYEELYNVFNAIQKRFGWGIFYVKGRFNEQAKKIAGSVVLNDTSIDGSGDAKFLTPPTPQGTIDTLNLMMESIQLGSSTTFLLPKDIKMSGDISGIAIMLTQSLDIENAMQAVVDWQNVADKAIRLFKWGYSIELVNKGLNPKAITEFAKLNISGKFEVWKPLNDYEYNQMIVSLVQGGVLSKESGIELNTLSKPDEKSRVGKEEEKLEEQELKREALKQSNNNNPTKKVEEE